MVYSSAALEGKASLHAAQAGCASRLRGVDKELKGLSLWPLSLSDIICTQNVLMDKEGRSEF